MKKIIIAASIILTLTGCFQRGILPKEETAGVVNPIDISSHFISDAAPLEREVISNPLKYAAKRIDLDIDNLELPRAYEGTYRLACRFPIIDSVSNRPLYMKQWAEDTTELINTQHHTNRLKTVLYAIEVLRGTNSFPQIELTYDKTALLDSLRSLQAEMEKQLAQSNFTPGYQKELLKLYQNYLIACELATQGKKNLTKEDLKFFNANPSYFLAPDGKKMPSVTGNVDSHFRFIERARLVAYEYIFLAAKILAEAISDYVNTTKTFQIADFFVDTTKSDGVFMVETQNGIIIVAGFGNDTYTEDSPLLIDLGGQDTYTNNAGSSRTELPLHPVRNDSSGGNKDGQAGMGTSVGNISNGAGGSYTKNSIALCIDHSGDDFYNAPEKNYVQGFGFLGAGFLVDISGNDKYYAKHFSQGVGVMGVGAIWDTSGDDVYDAHTFCQGAGMFGLGMLLDTSGEDSYDCASIGQGAATTLGLGILSDLKGNDKYQISVTLSKDNLGAEPSGYGQGGALSFRPWPAIKKLTAYGGVGILTDNEGNDLYKAGGWCDQGGSYIMSLGVLVDSYGNDHYTSARGSGSAIHISNAILIDKNGDDIYDGAFLVGGSGSDRSPGILIDYNGNDVYGTKDTIASFGAGCKPFGFSLFIDYKGDDKYTSKQPTTNIGHNWDSFGGVWPESEGHLWPYAICLDLNGNDDYAVKNRENNKERFSYGHGIHIDTESKDEDVIGKIQNPLEPYCDLSLPDSVTKSPYYNDIKLLQNPDLFTRFQAIGRISRLGIDVIPLAPLEAKPREDNNLSESLTSHSKNASNGLRSPENLLLHLVASIRDSSHRQFNRDVMECIHYYLTNNKVTDPPAQGVSGWRAGKDIPYLYPLLNAQDEEVRIIIVQDLGWWGSKDCEDVLIEMLKKDKSAQVRRFALSSLLTIRSNKAVPLVQQSALSDPSEDVRRLSVTFLGKMDKADSIGIILKALDKDPASSVRIAAAEAFVNFRDERALEPLRRAAKSEDFYLRRAAAKGLATLYQIDAIEILIDSMSFRSIDTGNNYGFNIPNFIASYAGFDFPESERYDQARWKKWFQENKDKIDIKKNIASSLDFAELTSSIQNASSEEKVVAYEEFLAKYPDYKQAKEKLGTLLNQLAWEMVTADKTTTAYNPEKGLKYAIRAVELQPIAMIIDTLVEAYYANGQIDKAIELCQEELKKSPNEKMFKDRLEKYLKEKK